MFSHSFQLATVRGIPIRVAPSWLVVAVLIVWSYRDVFIADDRSTALTLTLGVLAALLFTASVLIHELAHALEGQHRGAEVERIVLFLLGGATALRTGDRAARDELAIAAIGPWSNIVLAAMFGLVATFAGDAGLDAVVDVAALLGWLNIGLAVFNLFPGSPLDGGRVVRGLLWMLTGDRHRATVAAAVFGIVLSTGLLGLAAWVIISTEDGLLSGVWIGAIGAYMLRSARLELLRGRLVAWLAARPAHELATPLPIVDGHDDVATVRRALDSAERQSAALVMTDDGPTALVRRSALDDAAADATASSLGQPLDELPVVEADGPADELANLLDRDQPYVLVADDDGLWASSLELIEHEVRTRRRPQRQPAAEVPA